MGIQEETKKCIREEKLIKFLKDEEDEEICSRILSCFHMDCPCILNYTRMDVDKVERFFAAGLFTS